MNFKHSIQVLIVTYDLKTPGKSYAPFFETLKQQGPWSHYLSSTWLIATTKDAEQLYAAVEPHLSTTDSILIAPIGRPYFGTLPKEAWDWLQTHVPFGLADAMR